jgi:hypothetical protein
MPPNDSLGAEPVPDGDQQIVAPFTRMFDSPEAALKARQSWVASLGYYLVNKQGLELRLLRLKCAQKARTRNGSVGLRKSSACNTDCPFMENARFDKESASWKFAKASGAHNYLYR